MDKELTDAEFAALKAAGYRPAGGSYTNGVSKIRFVRNDVEYLATRAEWRAIIAGLPPTVDEEVATLRAEVERLGRIISALVEDAAGGEVMLLPGGIASARPIAMAPDGDYELVITVLY